MTLGQWILAWLGAALVIALVVGKIISYLNKEKDDV